MVEVILFIIDTKPTKYLGLNLTRFSYMKTAFKYFRRRPEWIEKFDIKEVSILPKLIYNFTTISLKKISGFWGAARPGNSQADSKTSRKINM